MNRFIKYTLGIIVNPKLTFQKVLQERPIGFIFTIVLISGILWGLIGFFYISDLPQMPSPELQRKISEVQRQISLAWPIIFIILWVVGSGLLRMAGRRLKGKATFQDMILVVGILSIIPLLLTPINLILLTLRLSPPISYIWPLLVDIWLLAVLIIGIREAQQFSIAKAIGSVVLSAVYGIGIPLVIMFFISLFVGFLYTYGFLGK